MDRTSVEELVARRYAEVHRATLRFEYPSIQMQKCLGETKAALGYRRADTGALFLETYLDAPIESVLQTTFGREFARRDIVEIGNLASCNAASMVALWASTANDLGSDAEIAVAVLTAPLRAMFGKLGIPLVHMLPADPSRLSKSRGDWGDYYKNEPLICAGLIAEGQKRLSHFAARIGRRAA